MCTAGDVDGVLQTLPNRIAGNDVDIPLENNALYMLDASIPPTFRGVALVKQIPADSSL